MAKQLINKGFNGWAQLGVFLGTMGVGLIAGTMVAAGVWAGMTGQGLLNMQHDMLNPQYATAVKMVQVVTTLFIFFIPAVCYAFICYRNGWLALGFNKSFYPKIMGLCILLLLVSMPFIETLGLINKSIPIPASSRAYFDSIEKSYEAQVKVIGDVKTIGQYLLSLIMIALLPAIFEETLFRGGLQNLLSRWKNNSFIYIVAFAILIMAAKSIWLPKLNGWFFYGVLLVLVIILFKSTYILQKLNTLTNHFLFPIILTSILFSAVHASWYGFIPRLALGGLLGLIFYYTNNLGYTILLHFLNNATVVTYMFINTRQHKPVSTETTETFPWWVAIISIVLLVVLFRVLVKSQVEKAPQEVLLSRDNPFDNTIFEGKDN
ncbi:MAG: CPBP family intramembrane glutamic endopeptidase [Bacteroidota bacterium]